MSPSGVIVVFAKAPRAGGVKTRMSPPLTPEEAADLYACMLDDVLAATAAACRELDLAPVLTVHPPGADAELVTRAPPGFRVVAQRGTDLSERMAWAVAEAAASGASPVLIRGSDSPSLAVGRIREVVAELESAELVIAPGVDGGYNLVGLQRPAPGLFDHPMSTRSVLDDTVSRARELGLRVRVLDETFDLDTAADFALLARARQESKTEWCPRTLAFMDDRDLWRHAPNLPLRAGGAG